MRMEDKKELLASLQGFLQGAQIGQFNMFVEDGATVNYNAGKESMNESPGMENAKQAIMEYVGRLKPLVQDSLAGVYDELWLGILELREVRLKVYDKGKQQNTTFNRDLVAQIVHQIGSRVYAVEAKPGRMAELLEPSKGKDHPVRQKLGESPEGAIKKAVEGLLSERIVKVDPA